MKMQRIINFKSQFMNHIKSNPILQQQMQLLSYKIAVRTILSCMVCIFCLQSQGQADDRIVKADQYFAAGEYYTAAHLYEQFLKPGPKQKTTANFPLNAKRNSQGSGMGKGVTKLDILYKQATSYRLANYFPEAAEAYKECMEKDPEKYVDAYYWYAVCKRSLADYTTAEESINQFLSKATANNSYRAAAEKEAATLRYIKSQLARPDTVMYKLQKTGLASGSDKGVYAPVHMGGNRFMVTSTQTDSVIVAAVNPYHSRLFTTSLVNGSLQNTEVVQIETTDATVNQGAASISANGNYLYFTQWKKENGRNISTIYYAVKKGNGWGAAQLLSAVNRNGYSSQQPYCTVDGKYLFFASNKPGGSGEFDIWYAALNADGTTGEAVNAGTSINTSADELAPFYHSTSSTLVFSSNGRQGMGGYDLFSAKGWETAWKTPENMGHPVNSTRDDLYFYAPEKTRLLSNAVFSSDRGSSCCMETFLVSKAPKKQKLTGTIRDLADKLPLANAEVILKDGTGKTWKAITGDNGRYTFDLVNEGPYSLTITKEYYKEKNTTAQIETTDESEWSTDVLKNKDEFIEKRVILKPETVVTVYFDFDMYNLKDSATEKLDSVYKVLVETPGATLQISGYTDGLGTVEYNKGLSDRRARACYQYLIGKGIDSSRITFESFGACCPLEMELINGLDNAAGRAKNRRALINVVMPKQE